MSGNTAPTRRSPLKLLSRQSSKSDVKRIGGGKYSWKPAVISLPPIDNEQLSDTDAEDMDGILLEEHDGIISPRSPRTNHYNENTWWLVDLHQLEELPQQQGASFLVARCMYKYKWTERHARRVLKAYFQFLSLHKHVNFPVWPCAQVLTMWNEHSLDVNNYPHDCELLSGRDIPLVSDANVTRKDSKEQTKTELVARFGKEFDKALWERKK